MVSFDRLYMSLVDFGPCKTCEHFNADKAISYCNSFCDAGSSPRSFCITMGEEYYKKINIGKYIVCEARDTSGRLFVLSLSSVMDYLTKDGWWNTFTLSSAPIEKEGLYLCKIERFCKDKDGYDMCITIPEKYMASHISEVRNYINGMYFLSRSKAFAIEHKLSDVDKSYDSYTNYSYRNVFEKLGDKLGVEYQEELYWLNEIIIAKKALKSYIKGKVTLKELNDAAVTETITFYWTTKQYRERCRIMCREKYKNKYPAVFEKAGDKLYDYNTYIMYIDSMLFKYEELVDNGTLDMVQVYDPYDDNMDLLDMLDLVSKYYLKQKEERKAAEKAARKAKRLAKKQAKKNKEEV